MLNDISKAKKSLIKKALNRGIYENFGQNEVQNLSNKYGESYFIDLFNNWCANYEVEEVE
jgi:hypothetical protein